MNMMMTKSVLVARTVDIDGIDNFPQGCVFSPDGLCVLTATVGDSKLRLYNTPSSLFRSSETISGTCVEKEQSDDTNDVSSINNNEADDLDNETNPTTTENVVEDWKVEVTGAAGDSVRSYSWYV